MRLLCILDSFLGVDVVYSPDLMAENLIADKGIWFFFVVVFLSALSRGI